MRKILILFLLLLPAIGWSQYTPVKMQANIFKYSDPLDPNDKLFGGDKIDHILWSINGTMMVSGVLYHLNVKNPEIKGVGIMMTCGFAKEFLIDKRPSASDILANFTGVIAGYYLSKWSNKQYAKEKAKYRIVVTNQVQ